HHILYAGDCGFAEGWLLLYFGLHVHVDMRNTRQRAEQHYRIIAHLILGRTRRSRQNKVKGDVAALDLQILDEPERDNVSVQVRILDLAKLGENLLLADHRILLSGKKFHSIFLGCSRKARAL